MSKDARPNDLITTAEAAKIAERSERTIRRWTQPKVGKLARWLGEPAVTGGAASVLVSRRELMTRLVVSGQEPRIEGNQHPLPASADTAADMVDTSPTDMRSSPTDIRVAILEERLQAAELRAELASVKAERDGLLRQVGDLRDLAEDHRRRSDTAHAELRADLDSERDRCRAQEAELKALREFHGVSWWRKLLGGPTAVAAIPEAK